MSGLGGKAERQSGTPKGELDVRDEGWGARARRRRWGRAAAGRVFLTGNGEDREERPSGTVTQQPKASDPFWVNPGGNAARQVTAYEKAGRAAERTGSERSPSTDGGVIGPENPAQEARGFTEAAARADRTALLVLYNIPHRDCGQFSQGGAADGDAYRAWIDGVARGIGDRRGDGGPGAGRGAAHGGRLHSGRVSTRSGTTCSRGITTLKALKNAKVYLERATRAGSTPTGSSNPSSGRVSSRRTASR